MAGGDTISCNVVQLFEFSLLQGFGILHIETSHVFPVVLYPGGQGDCSTKFFIEYQCGPVEWLDTNLLEVI